MNLDADLLRQRVTVELPLIAWLAIHGNLCLALRHPQNRGPSRLTCIDALERLAELIIEHGLMTREEMAEAHRVEQQEGGLGT